MAQVRRHDDHEDHQHDIRRAEDGDVGLLPPSRRKGFLTHRNKVEPLSGKPGKYQGSPAKPKARPVRSVDAAYARVRALAMALPVDQRIPVLNRYIAAQSLR